MVVIISYSQIHSHYDFYNSIIQIYITFKYSIDFIISDNQSFTNLLTC